jgi:hypothetical protein
MVLKSERLAGEVAERQRSSLHPCGEACGGLTGQRYITGSGVNSESRGPNGSMSKSFGEVSNRKIMVNHVIMNGSPNRGYAHHASCATPEFLLLS